MNSLFAAESGDSTICIGWTIVLATFFVLGLWYSRKAAERLRSRTIALDAALKSLPDFSSALRIIGCNHTTGIAVDEKRKKICLFSAVEGQTIATENPSYRFRIHSFHDIIESEIDEDGQTISKASTSSLITRAVVGGVLAGGVGALIGGVTGKRSERRTVQQIRLRVTVNSTSEPLHTVTFLEGQIDVADPRYKEVMTEITEWQSRMTVVIHRGKEQISDQSPTEHTISLLATCPERAISISRPHPRAERSAEEQQVHGPTVAGRSDEERQAFYARLEAQRATREAKRIPQWEWIAIIGVTIGFLLCLGVWNYLYQKNSENELNQLERNTREVFLPPGKQAADLAAELEERRFRKQIKELEDADNVRKKAVETLLKDEITALERESALVHISKNISTTDTFDEVVKKLGDDYKLLGKYSEADKFTKQIDEFMDYRWQAGKWEATVTFKRSAGSEYWFVNGKRSNPIGGWPNERVSDDLLRKAEEAAEKGKAALARQIANQILREHPFSRAAAEVRRLTRY